MPVMHMRAAFVPESIDREARTVEVVWTTGARVLRRGFFDTFFEELGLEKKEVRMERLLSGAAPVLDNHGFTDKGGMRAQVGVVQKAELIPGKEGKATLRFSKREEVEDIFRDIEDGIFQNISVGYNVYRLEKVGEEEGDVPVLRATDWEPFEVSLVPAGADMSAKIRSGGDNTSQCVVVDQNEEASGDISEPEILEEKENSETSEQRNIGGNDKMGDENENEVKTNEAELKAREASARKEGVEAERKRCTEIRSIVKKIGLEEKVAEDFIENDKSIDEVRAEVIDMRAKADEKKTTSAANVTVGEDLSRKGRIEGMASALLHRFRPLRENVVTEAGRSISMPGFELSESGRRYAFLSLAEMARCILQENGVDVAGLPRHRIADMALSRSGMHSTSDFPEILANVAGKTLRAGYQAAPKTWGHFTNETFVSDFKEISRTNLGDAPELLEVPEGGEVKRGSLSETAEKYRVREFARIVALTRKTIVNDDLAAFTQLPERMGRRASDLESKLIWDIIKANPDMADSNALFSSQHGNLAASEVGGPDEAALALARTAMRKQTGLDGQELGLVPVWLFVPPTHETDAEKLLATITPDSSGNVSPFSSQGRTPLRLEVEPRLETGDDGSDAAWYVTADKGQVDMMELARLEGTDGPQLQTRDGFDISGVELKIQHDVGAKAIDHRGMYKNPGE